MTWDEDALTSLELFNVELLTQDTEYSQVIPENTRKLVIMNRAELIDVRYSFTSGLVASATPPYIQLIGGEDKEWKNMNLTAHTIYFAAATPHQYNDDSHAIIEIECWR